MSPQSFHPELTVDSRLQVKMNSLDCTRNNSAEQEEARDPGKLYFCIAKLAVAWFYPSFILAVITVFSL